MEEFKHAVDCGIEIGRLAGRRVERMLKGGFFGFPHFLEGGNYMTLAGYGFSHMKFSSLPALADMPAPLITTTFLLDCKSSFTRTKSFAIVNAGIFQSGVSISRLLRCIIKEPWSEALRFGESESSIIIGQSVQLVARRDNAVFGPLTSRAILSTCFPLLGFRGGSQIDIELMIPIGIMIGPKGIAIVAKLRDVRYGRHIQGFLNPREGKIIVRKMGVRQN